MQTNWLESVCIYDDQLNHFMKDKVSMNLENCILKKEFFLSDNFQEMFVGIDCF